MCVCVRQIEGDVFPLSNSSQYTFKMLVLLRRFWFDSGDLITFSLLLDIGHHPLHSLITIHLYCQFVHPCYQMYLTWRLLFIYNHYYWGLLHILFHEEDVSVCRLLQLSMIWYHLDFIKLFGILFPLYVTLMTIP